MNKGIIVSLIAGEYKIYDNASKIYLKAKPRGIFRIKTETLKVGDHIEYEIKDGSTVITKLDKRINDLTRPMIANIEQAFVVFSVKEPDLNLNLLDRFLAILEYNQIPQIIVFNKWDLLEHEEIKTVETIKNAGYEPAKDVKIAIDVAASDGSGGRLRINIYHEKTKEFLCFDYSIIAKGFVDLCSFN